ncbi:helix-turn-helix domain-containing protein [Methylobacterium gregans]|uniref:HTH cro/C1-type domain-containing protein n=1 Tax=Methylobacterium gregans TaxID=374424 RepID=A0AA37HMN7_9HYPH|nr:helix-turn-helix transcriptional regulator [Methylobacterium gregans]MDQ0522000.1 transcriptional regulator with XRE-family HTH domain [Methylobacterium gregans]GJD77968.1 hypothetical protein NBEOAGPD_1180 [Methylobacterium gregans]GLS51938.1 hypothetical protein GCM10007886_01200 [Methylobacterium gregans]
MRPARTSDTAFLRETCPSRPRSPDPAIAAVGTALRTARARRGIAQREVAAHAAVSLRTVQAWESGRERIPSDHLETLTGFLQLAPDALDGATHVARTAEERALLAAHRIAVAEGKAMTFPPATDAALQEAQQAYDRAGIDPDPRPDSEGGPPPQPPAQVFPPAIRLGALFLAIAGLIWAGVTSPWVMAALVPAALVLGVGVAQAIHDLAQVRGASRDRSAIVAE